MAPPHGLEPRTYWLQNIYSTGVGSSLTVATDIINFTKKICRDTSNRSSLAPANANRSSIIVLLQDQGLLIRKWGVPRGYGLANEETDVG